MIRASARARVGSFVLEADFEAGTGPVLLVGPNGSGKSTMLRCLAGLIKCSSALVVDGEPLGERDVLYVPPRPTLPRGLTVGEALKLLAEFVGGEPLVDELGVGGLLGRRVEGLSSGEAQRVMLAAALGSGKFLLIDEPLAHLDAEWRARVARLVARRRNAIIATHDIEMLAAAANGHAVALSRGRVTYSGPVPGTPIGVLDRCGEDICVRRGRLGDSPIALGPLP